MAKRAVKIVVLLFHCEVRGTWQRKECPMLHAHGSRKNLACMFELWAIVVSYH